MGNNEKAILRTLLYADIFKYPLKEEELWRFLMVYDGLTSKRLERVTRSSFKTALRNLSVGINQEQGYYFLPRRNFIKLRRQRASISAAKMLLAKKIARYLSFLPTILFVGASGAVAMENTTENDDIDFFLIVKANSVWTTRLISLLFLTVIGKRRKRNQRLAKDAICLNMILSERSLSLSLGRQDMYSAHEVAQVLPLFERGNIYTKFINSNNWVKKLLPNTTKITFGSIKRKDNNLNKFIAELVILLEPLAKTVQFWYIARHATTETFSDTMMAFHPFDYKTYIIKEYTKRLKKYEAI